MKFQWTHDCQDKQDYDGQIVTLSSRYWPQGGGFTFIDTATGQWEENEHRPHIKPSAVSTIYLGEDVELASARFEGETEAEVKAKVESWVNEQTEQLVALLKNWYGKQGTT